MKIRKYSFLLLVEAVITLILTKGMNVKIESIFDILSFPLQKIADFLGYLSLKSSMGNIVAIVFFTLFCLVPVFILLLKMKTKTFVKTDSLLVLLSVVLFAVIYLLINPSELGLIGYMDGASTVTFSFWSLLASYFILKLVDTIKNSSAVRSELIFDIIIKIIGAVFVFDLCNMEFTKTEVWIVSLIAFVNSALPSLFGLLIVFSCLRVLSCFALDRYSDNTIHSAEKLSSLCMVSLKTSAVVTALYSVIQLRFISELSDINFSINTPLAPLCFILLTLIITKFLRDSKELKEDNDSFI
jgi:hypothetical protein